MNLVNEKKWEPHKEWCVFKDIQLIQCACPCRNCNKSPLGDHTPIVRSYDEEYILSWPDQITFVTDAECLAPTDVHFPDLASQNQSVASLDEETKLDDSGSKWYGLQDRAVINFLWPLRIWV